MRTCMLHPEFLTTRIRIRIILSERVHKDQTVYMYAAAPGFLITVGTLVLVFAYLVR